MGVPDRRTGNDNVSDRTCALTRRTWIAGVSGAIALCGAEAPDDLRAAFVSPPASSRPKAFWLWINGNVTRQGITLDLEAMQRVGIGGVFIFDGSTWVDKGPAGYLSAEWRELMKHAISEGARLGVEIGMHNAPGWSSSGGPWITPERAMQQLVWTETVVSGPGEREIQLPQPRAHLGYYRDAMVVAFPAAPDEDVQPKRVERSTDAVTIEYEHAFEVRAVTVFPAFGARFQNVAIEASDDGAAWRLVATVANPGRHGIQPPGVRSFAPISARSYRASGRGAGELAEVALHHTARIEDWNYKANFAYRVGRQLEMPEPLAGDHAIDPGTVVNLSQFIDPQGKLSWNVPAGTWIVLRFGHTATGQLNVSASEVGRGLESDKLSAQATEFHFRHVIATVLADCGGLRNVLIDSYEAGLQNWTADFPARFLEHAGYPLDRYLPAMTGRIVGDRSLSERFLFDVRRAQAELMTASYYAKMGELCRRNGLKYYVEGYGQGVFDEMQVSGSPDVPTTEFWERTPWTPNRSVKMVASAAHVYGRPVVAAEAFTGEEQTARWLEYPYSLKALGDLMFSQGVNEFIFHRYAHQPHPTAVPGMTMGPWGFHMDRTNIWFEHSSAWLTYLARCQTMLRQGTNVADIAWFTGERPPGAENFEIPAVPAGFCYDLINREALLQFATVKDGRIELTGGASYSVLVLPPELKGATPDFMRALRRLVQQGAHIVGPKPSFSPTLSGYPNSQREVRQIADELWDSGRIASTLDMRSAPDFEYAGVNAGAALSWSHRRVAGTDIYFVANRQRRVEEVLCTFRVRGLEPELWNPETGEIRSAPVYDEVNGHTRVPLRLEPAGSLFVVFRNWPRTAAAKPVEITPRPLVRFANTFTMSVWAKPDTDLRLMPRESTTGHIDETGKFYLIQAGEPDPRFGEGHASAGLAVGRNGVYVIERSSKSSPAVLVALMPISGWTHFAVVYDGGTPSLYVNGKFVRKGLRSGSTVLAGFESPPPRPETTFHFAGIDALMRTSGRVALPSNGLAYYFEGNFTRPLYAPVARTAAEVAAMAAATMPGPEGSPATLISEVRGPWQVRFQAGRGAPRLITLPELASFHKHADLGVKYFAGLATYARELDIPREQLGKRLYLDLGRVEVTAAVRLNGKPLGVAWKEPYRVEITSAARPGGNALEIEVANLWTNRLIGDEQLPVENEYASGAEHRIVKLPDWYVNGKPKPPGGRISFATWRFYDKNDPLVESGLLGPVRVVSVD